MSSRYASGRKAAGYCDVCGFRYKLHQLRSLVVKRKETNIKACPTCWDKDHPQLLVGTFPVDDPQAIRNPRPDTSTVYAGNETMGSRIYQWGWAPVGGGWDSSLTPNDLHLGLSLGAVTVQTL